MIVKEWSRRNWLVWSGKAQQRKGDIFVWIRQNLNGAYNIKERYLS